MHIFPKAEDYPSGSTRHDCQGSRPPACHVLPRGFLWNEGNQSGARPVHFAVALLLAFWVLLAKPPVQAQTPTDADWTITTVAGTRESGYNYKTGDGGPAVEATLDYASAVAVDGAGNLYIAEQNQDRIRRVDPKGTITTFAGTGDHGYSGDGGPAVKARLRYPNDVAVDGAGNVYIASWLPARSPASPVRKVDSTGTITTIPGEFMSDVVAVDGAGNLYIVDSNPTSATLNVVRKVDTAGSTTTVAGIERMIGPTGDGVRAVETPLPQVFDLAVDDAGNLYIAAGHSVHKVDSAGIITTVAGWRGEEGNWDGSGDGVRAVGAPLNGAIAVTVDRAGNLFIADKHNCRIRRVDSTGTINTIAGGECGKNSWTAGQVVEGVFRDMQHVAVDGAGNLYVADGIRILKVHP